VTVALPENVAPTLDGVRLGEAGAVLVGDVPAWVVNAAVNVLPDPASSALISGVNALQCAKGGTVYEPVNVVPAVRLNAPDMVTVIGFDVAQREPTRFTEVPCGDTSLRWMLNVAVEVTVRELRFT
jgi:hypothetical protein